MNSKLHSRIFGVAILILGGILAMHMTVGGADRNQGRSMVISRYGIVAAESPLAAQAGAQILERGGNAVDAAVAANAMMGRGRADDERHRRRSFRHRVRREERETLRPERQRLGARRTDHSISEGPRAPRNAGARHSIRSPFPERWMAGKNSSTGSAKRNSPKCSRPAIRAAEDGFPVTEWIGRTSWKDGADSLRENEAAAQTYLISRPRAGHRANCFAIPIWRGRCARSRRAGATPSIAAKSRKTHSRASARHGGTLAEKDFADYSSEWVEPISTTYRGWTVYELPPNGQGIAALEMLNIMEQFPLR